MKRFLKIFFSLTFLILTGTILSACGSNTLIPVAGVDFYEDEVFATVGDQIALEHKVYPSNASNRLVSYWSSDENIVSVDENGVATIKDTGEALVVVRSIDGGFEDYCRIVTKIDPDEIMWNTEDGRIEPVSDHTLPYSATATVAVDQDVKLEVLYSLSGIVGNTAITNKNIKFTSSNPDNIEVINESEGILRAIDNNIRSEDNTPYSDITASIQTSKGELKITCRVFVNEYSTTGKLIVNKVNGNSAILKERDGSDKIVLDADDKIGVECYALLLNASNYKKSDYSISIYSSNKEVFDIIAKEEQDSIYYFTILPKKEGNARLCIDTTCYDESGKQISVVINVSVQASVDFVEVTASNKYEITEEDVTLTEIDHYEDNCAKQIIDGVEVCVDSEGNTIPEDGEHILVPVYKVANIQSKTEIVVDQEIFSLGLTFYDESVIDGIPTTKLIEGAEREIYIESLDTDLIVYKDASGNAYTYIGEEQVYLKTLNNSQIESGGRVYKNCSQYISTYGNNSFKVTAVPTDINTEFYILGYVAKNNSSDVLDINNRVYFVYTFYIRSALENVIISTTPATVETSGGGVVTTIPSTGISEVTIILGRELDLYIYSYSFNMSAPQPVKVKVDSSSLDGIIEMVQDENKYTLKACTGTAGEGVIVVTATDGENTVSTQILVHVVNVEV